MSTKKIISTLLGTGLLIGLGAPAYSQAMQCGPSSYGGCTSANKVGDTCTHPSGAAGTCGYRTGDECYCFHYKVKPPITDQEINQSTETDTLDGGLLIE